MNRNSKDKARSMSGLFVCADGAFAWTVGL
jgi:hypothetical protein